MPPALLIPLAVAALSTTATAVESNVAQKNSIKQQENNQLSKIGNAKAASAAAQASVNPYLGAGAAPTGGAVGRPTAAAASPQLDPAKLLAQISGAGGSAAPGLAPATYAPPKAPAAPAAQLAPSVPNATNANSGGLNAVALLQALTGTGTTPGQQLI